MITEEKIKELMKIKVTDRKRFYKALEKMAREVPHDILLTYRKFKEYAPSV